MATQTDELLAYARLNPLHGPGASVPSRHIALVTCMDARIDAFSVFGLAVGEAHILRTAGGIVTDDVLRSLVLSQRLLQTREVLIMAHTDCGLQKADEATLRAQIEAETGAAPAYAFGTFTDLDASVRASVARVREHPFLPHRANVRGFVYDVASGEVREVDV